MTDKLKFETIDNPDGTRTIRVTEDFSQELRIWQRKVLMDQVGVIRNIGPNNESAIITAPPSDQDFGWKRDEE